MKKKEIITICSSASFYKDVLDIETQLKKCGFKVKVPKTANTMKRTGDFNVDHYRTWFKKAADYKIKTRLMNGHFKKVVESDAILVVNQEKKGIRGYIGGNVLMEMAIAFHYKKPIYLWNPIDHTSPFEEEIKGMNAIVIDQELSKIVI